LSTDLKTILSEFIKIYSPKGPLPSFSISHIVKTLLLLESSTIGRQALSKMLKIGEGATRTIIKKLYDKGIIAIDPVGGCYLTDYGKLITKKLREYIISEKEADLKEFGIFLPAWAIHIRSSHIPNITKARDIGIRYGAEGVLIFHFKNSKISLPMITDDISKDYPNTSKFIRSFTLNENDLVIIGFAKDIITAEIATIAIAIHIILETM